VRPLLRGARERVRHNRLWPGLVRRRLPHLRDGLGRRRHTGARRRMSMVSPAKTPLAPASRRATIDAPGRVPWSGLLFAGTLATVLWAPIPFGSVEPWAVGLLRLMAFLLLGL